MKHKTKDTYNKSYRIRIENRIHKNTYNIHKIHIHVCINIDIDIDIKIQICNIVYMNTYIMCI